MVIVGSESPLCFRSELLSWLFILIRILSQSQNVAAFVNLVGNVDQLLLLVLFMPFAKLVLETLLEFLSFYDFLYILEKMSGFIIVILISFVTFGGR